MKRSELSELHTSLVQEFTKTLDSFGPAFKPKQKKDMIAGFTDGLSSMRAALVARGALVVEND